MALSVFIIFLSLFQPAVLLPHICQYQLAPTSSGSYHQFSQVELAPYELHQKEEGASITEIHPTASAAAHACYQYCNQSELMTFSSQFWKHRHAPLTLLDRATHLLLEREFFKVNETYYINYMTMTDQDGPSGLGCFALETPSKFTLYALGNPLCRFTKSVICGGGGKTGAVMDLDKPVDRIGKVNLAETISRHTDPSRFKTTFFSGVQPEEEEQEGQEEILDTIESSFSLRSSCSKLGSLDSTSLPRFTSWLEQYHSTHTPVVIKAWNDDTYGTGSGHSCLAFSLAQGIHVSPCSELNLYLCSLS